jgi:heme/copper-type cytochrome/quinol oxidase subunit 2
MRDKLNGIKASTFVWAWLALTVVGTFINTSSGKTIYAPDSNLFGDLLGELGGILLLFALFLFSYHKYSKKVSQHHKARILGIVSTLLGIIVVYAAAILSSALIGNLSNRDAGAGGSSQPATNNSVKTYTSAQYNFSADFPGLPVEKNSSEKIQDHDVPTTTIEKELDNGGKVYYIQIVNYPSDFDMSDTTARLEGAFNGSVQNTKGASNPTNKLIKFANHDGISGSYDVDSDGQTYTVRLIHFLNGNQLYSLMAIGTSDEEYQSFISSFHFVNQ